MYKIIFPGPYLMMELGRFVWDHVMLVNMRDMDESIRRGIDITASINRRDRELKAQRQARERA